jgi:homocitrate synthase NifV
MLPTLYVHINFKAETMIIDSTLREGAQLFHAYFEMAEKKALVRKLLQTGVEEMELGWTGMKGIEELAGWVKGLKPTHTVFSIWAPCRKTSLEEAVALGVGRVNMGMPVSDAHLRKRMGLSRKSMHKRLAQTIRKGTSMGLEVSVGLEDISRADPEFALETARMAQEAGAFRIRLADTVGVWTPGHVQKLVGEFRKIKGIQLALHLHNDFGMATANAVTGLEAGAQWVDASVLGIGERSGIAVLEEVMSWAVLAASKARYDLKHLPALCTMVATTCNIPLSRIKPLLGKDVFSCESGLHLHGMHQDNALFEPFEPHRIGARRQKGFGAKVGRAALRQVLHDQGITLSEALLKRVLNTVHKTASLHKRPLSPREVRELALVCQKNSSRAQPGVCEANKADSPLWRHPLGPVHVSANPIG